MSLMWVGQLNYNIFIILGRGGGIVYITTQTHMHTHSNFTLIESFIHHLDFYQATL